MFYMPPNVKFVSVHITSSLIDVSLQEVVGMARNNITHDLVNKPSQLYNVDETGVPFNPRPPNIVATKGRKTKKVRYRTSGRKGQLTVVACANAAGQTIP